MLNDGMYAPSRPSFKANLILLARKNFLFCFLQYFCILIIKLLLKFLL